MDFDLNLWLSELLGRIRAAFGARLLFAGHIGSHARGEATDSSDIDVNIVLDQLTTDDLRVYRSIIQSMPHREKACGFICGRREMECWPAHELFQFAMGCRVLHGRIEDVARHPSDRDIHDNIINTVSAIYHQACHMFVFSADIAADVEGLKLAYKTAFFALQEWYYLKERRYLATKGELLPLLEGSNHAILDICMRWDALRDDRVRRPEYYYAAIRDWSSGLLTEPLSGAHR